MPNILTSSLTALTKRLVHPRDVSEGSFGQCHYQCATLDVSGITIFQVVVDLPSGIGGSIQVEPAGPQKPLWDNSQTLESIDFNERIKVYASTRDLAFKVLAPDFMAWLLDQTDMPSFYIVGIKCFIAFRETIGATKDVRIGVAEKVVARIIDSGALVKSTVP